MNAKYIGIFVALIFGIIFFFVAKDGPKASAISECYSNFTESYNKDSLYSKTYSWSDEKLCTENARSISQLDGCLSQAKITFAITEDSYKKLFKWKKLLHPKLLEYSDVRLQHNNQCLKYNDSIVQ